MPDLTTPELAPAFVCYCRSLPIDDDKDFMRLACAGEPFYREHEGKPYCVLHFPGKEKSADFEFALQKKLAKNDFNFTGVWFPDEIRFVGFDADPDFQFARFDANAAFSGATFKGEALFHSATFSATADFHDVTFSAEAHFPYATFNATANFEGATFKANTIFGSAAFRAEADFRHATFEDHVKFGGKEEEGGNPVLAKSLNLQFARIQKPEHVSFRTLTLQPNWFVNVDPRKFDFTNVDWRVGNVNKEVQSLKTKVGGSPHRLLAIACRRLAANSEENNRYEEASKFRYLAMDAERREGWRFAPWRLSWWYWFASGYGERALQAFLVLLGIWILFGLLYTRVFVRWEPKMASEPDAVAAKRDAVGAPLEFRSALAYSASVMTLQKPEPRPATTAAQTVVLLETILGPVQAALLALAIRRKFMR